MGSVLVYYGLVEGREKELLKWTPNQRILSRIKTDSLVISPKSKCKLMCIGVSWAEMKIGLSEAKVHLDKSNVEGMAKTYVVSIPTKGKQALVGQFLFEENSIELLDLDDRQQDCICD